MLVDMKGGGGASRWKASLAASLDGTELSHTRATYSTRGQSLAPVQGILFLKVDNLRVLYGSPALLPLCTSLAPGLRFCT